MWTFLIISATLLGLFSTAHEQKRLSELEEKLRK